eukprot:TRINITY_DN13481_c0_g1_i1.p1 TRINITY_DN13481_c0_g1~~TRINITY_DN13481_c0_g1_i1.p1  ORF type:complete len:628 (-),score=84.05 TRINITY_DN13481_c0_g1_i1:252-2066(-)
MAGVPSYSPPMPFTPRQSPRESCDNRDAACGSPRSSRVGFRATASPAPAMGAVRHTPLGPRETYDTKFSHRYAVSEVFPSRGRRHFSPGGQTNPLNIPQPTDGMNVPLLLGRALAGRSRGPSASPERRADRSASPPRPNLFDSTPGAWRSPRRSPVRSPRCSPSRSPSPSEAISEVPASWKHRTPLNSTRVRELLSDEVPQDGEVARQTLAPCGRRLDPSRNLSPGVAEGIVHGSPALAGAQGTPARPWFAAGRHPSASRNLSPGVRSLLSGEAAVAGAGTTPQSPRALTAASRNFSCSTRALVQAEVVQAEITHQTWQQENNVQPKGKGTVGIRPLQPLPPPFAKDSGAAAITGVGASSAQSAEEARRNIGTAVAAAAAAAAGNHPLPAQLADVARSCLQRAELRERAENLRLRDGKVSFDSQPRFLLGGMQIRGASSASNILGGQSSRGSLGWESTTAGNSAGGSTCGSNCGDSAAPGGVLAAALGAPAVGTPVAGRGGKRAAKPPGVRHSPWLLPGEARRSSAAAAAKASSPQTPSTAPSTPAQAQTSVLPSPVPQTSPVAVNEELRLKVVQECTDQVADAVASLMARATASGGGIAPAAK